jgi:tripartite-type tricarboxylate transporter receptor subunit TctC
MMQLRLVTAAIVALCAVSAGAQTPAEFYKGKTISLLIGFGVGGEDDLWARAISRHIGNHLPGNPIMVPQNVPGSGGLLVANRIANTVPKDGTVIGLINRGIPFEPLLGGQGAQFDVMKLNWIGSPSRDTTVCAARKDAEVKTLADLTSKELSVGGTGSGADTAIYPEFLSALLGLKFKLVKGYQGSHEIQLAMERGEVQGICLAYDSLSRGNLARTGRINVLLQAALEPDPRLHGVPSVADLARSETTAGLSPCSSRAPQPAGPLSLRPTCRPTASRRCGRLRRDAARPGLSGGRPKAESPRRPDHRPATFRHHRRRPQDTAGGREAHAAGSWAQ